jgi:hypothetical protein
VTEPNLTKKDREYQDLIERIARHNGTSPEQVRAEANGLGTRPGEDGQGSSTWARAAFERNVLRRLTAIAIFTGIIGVTIAMYVVLGLAAFLTTAVPHG